MALNKVKDNSNMYQFVNATWNPISGLCGHMCQYCYAAAWYNRFKKPTELKLNEKNLNDDLGKDNFIFVESMGDLFAADIPDEWIMKVLDYCRKFDNKYLFQSKNPQRIYDFLSHPVFIKSVACTTIETNRHYPQMGNTPNTWDRADAMHSIRISKSQGYVTIEPIMDFDMDDMVFTIRHCKPTQVNIGADSGRNKLPEPSKEKILELISELQEFTTVVQKSNLKRLLL